VEGDGGRVDAARVAADEAALVFTSGVGPSSRGLQAATATTAATQAAKPIGRMSMRAL
jgi:hypothetical protein